MSDVAVDHRPHEHETPGEAAHRKVAEWARGVLAPRLVETPDPAGPIPFADLRHGMSLRIGGEWCQVLMVRTGPGDSLRLVDDDGHRFDYPVTDGELFTVAGF